MSDLRSRAGRLLRRPGAAYRHSHNERWQAAKAARRFAAAAVREEAGARHRARLAAEPVPWTTPEYEAEKAAADARWRELEVQGRARRAPSGAWMTT